MALPRHQIEILRRVRTDVLSALPPVIVMHRSGYSRRLDRNLLFSAGSRLAGFSHSQRSNLTFGEERNVRRALNRHPC
jgi:hypothetical protein